MPRQRKPSDRRNPEPLEAGVWAPLPAVVRHTGIGRGAILAAIKRGDSQGARIGKHLFVNVTSLRRLLGVREYPVAHIDDASRESVHRPTAQPDRGISP